MSFYPTQSFSKMSESSPDKREISLWELLVHSRVCQVVKCRANHTLAAVALQAHPVVSSTEVLEARILQDLAITRKTSSMLPTILIPNLKVIQVWQLINTKIVTHQRANRRRRKSQRKARRIKRKKRVILLQIQIQTLARRANQMNLKVPQGKRFIRRNQKRTIKNQ